MIISTADVVWLEKTKHLSQVLEIENASFEFTWTAEDFERYRCSRNSIGMVAEHEERVVGYMVYELCKTRLDFLNLAVHADFRRRGVGTAMVAKLVGKLSPDRRTRLTTHVRETNLPAQLFFRAVGFHTVSVLHDYYDEGTSTDDAYVFEYRITTGCTPTNRIARYA